jgi:general secretion pathway protein J
MKLSFRMAGRGFTLIELLTAMLILSLLAIMSYRGLGAVFDARTRVTGETQKWRAVTTFFARFEQDIQLAAPRPSRSATDSNPAWIGRAETSTLPRLEFSRFTSIEGADSARRVGYRLNEKQELELWLWTGLDIAPDALPARYVLLPGVTSLDLQYLSADLTWVDAWPLSRLDAAVPRAVRVRLVLNSSEEIVRIFALQL